MSHPGKSHLCGLARLSLIHTKPAPLRSAPPSSPGGQKGQQKELRDSREEEIITATSLDHSVTLSLSETDSFTSACWKVLMEKVVRMMTMQWMKVDSMVSKSTEHCMLLQGGVDNICVHVCVRNVNIRSLRGVWRGINRNPTEVPGISIIQWTQSEEGTRQ